MKGRDVTRAGMGGGRAAGGAKTPKLSGRATMAAANNKLRRAHAYKRDAQQHPSLRVRADRVCVREQRKRRGKFEELGACRGKFCLCFLFRRAENFSKITIRKCAKFFFFQHWIQF